MWFDEIFKNKKTFFLQIWTNRWYVSWLYVLFLNLIWNNYVQNLDFDKKSWIVDFFHSIYSGKNTTKQIFVSQFQYTKVTSNYKILNFYMCNFFLKWKVTSKIWKSTYFSMIEFRNSYFFLRWNFNRKNCFVVFFLKWNEWKIHNSTFQVKISV